MVEFGHSGSLVRLPRSRRRLQIVRPAPAEEQFVELAAAVEELNGGLLAERDAFVRAGRAYLVVLVGSLLLWVLIALAIFELFTALAG